MNFNYYYGSQADLFSFIRIPRIMLTDPAFANLSLHAKVLYSVLLDRMSLSRKNGWFDEGNRVFIIYQIGEIQNDLGFTKKKAMELLGELESFGLLEKKRRGHGLPNILYVKNFMHENGAGTVSDNIVASPESGNRHEEPYLFEKSVNDVSGAETGSSAIFRSAGSVPSDCSEEADMAGNKMTDLRSGDADIGTSEERNTQWTDTVSNGQYEPRGSKTGISGRSGGAGIGTLEVPKAALQEVSKTALQEVRKSAPLKNKININNTYRSNTESNLIASLSCAETRGDDEIRSESDGMLRSEQIMPGPGEKAVIIAEAYRQIIMDNIAYNDLLIAYSRENRLIDGIVDLILETVLCRQDYIVIASNRYPTQIVRNKFLKLNYMHIEYVLNCLRKNTSRIGNIRKYLLAALFNAPSTMDGYYRAEANYGLNQLAEAE